jgi:hypothetical protein
MIKLLRTSFIFLILISSTAHSEDFISKYVPDAKEVCSGRLKVLLWDV